MAASEKKVGWWADTKRDLQKNKWLYLMVVPLLAFILVFNYAPMAGLLMAFENYKIKLGIFRSPWVGLQNFKDFFGSIYFARLIGNTLKISFLQLVIEFPTTIVFALLLNEVKWKPLQKATQTITYMPYFISMVIMAGIIVDFTKSTGVISQAVAFVTGSSPVNLLAQPKAWRPLYIVSDLWQGLGFGSIIYIAALTGIDQELYEAAVIDGASRWKQTIHVTLPGISSTIIIMLILRLGNMMSVGYEKTILLYNSQIYDTADIISSYVYRKGLIDFDYSYSTAVTLFNSVINFVMLLFTNWLSNKYTETSLF